MPEIMLEVWVMVEIYFSIKLRTCNKTQPQRHRATETEKLMKEMLNELA